MSNGFGEGYFGMQVNSATERRILFSIWSPFTTNDPNSIPPSDRVALLKKGVGVTTGEFGNEGSGGQSYLKFNWRAGTTYKFLVRGLPSGLDNSTTYTAYFLAPEDGSWKLIASFKRPKTSTYLKGLYSFLENFNTETGNVKRMALYSNQWVRDNLGNWMQLTKATFTIDDTGRKNYRKDYAGGLMNGMFFLQMGGFFNEFVSPDQSFTRPLSSQQLNLDLASLP
jgi:hypothetical protein